MLKRTFWFGTGVTAGFGGAVWIRRRLLRTVRRYAPDQVQAEVTSSVRRLSTDLRSALRDGRDAMADRESQLRSELAPASRVPTGHAGGPAVATGQGEHARHH
jgi:hypothetical protein